MSSSRKWIKMETADSATKTSMLTSDMISARLKIYSFDSRHPFQRERLPRSFANGSLITHSSILTSSKIHRRLIRDMPSLKQSQHAYQSQSGGSSLNELPRKTQARTTQSTLRTSSLF